MIKIFLDENEKLFKLSPLLMKNANTRTQPIEIKLSIKSPDTTAQKEAKKVVPVKISVVPDRARRDLSTNLNSTVPHTGGNRTTAKGVVKG